MGAQSQQGSRSINLVPLIISPIVLLVPSKYKNNGKRFEKKREAVEQKKNCIKRDKGVESLTNMYYF